MARKKRKPKREMKFTLMKISTSGNLKFNDRKFKLEAMDVCTSSSTNLAYQLMIRPKKRPKIVTNENVMTVSGAEHQYFQTFLG